MNKQNCPYYNDPLLVSSFSILYPALTKCGDCKHCEEKNEKVIQNQKDFIKLK